MTRLGISTMESDLVHNVPPYIQLSEPFHSKNLNIFLNLYFIFLHLGWMSPFYFRYLSQSQYFTMCSLGFYVLYISGLRPKYLYLNIESELFVERKQPIHFSWYKKAIMSEHLPFTQSHKEKSVLALSWSCSDDFYKYLFAFLWFV